MLAPFSLLLFLQCDDGFGFYILCNPRLDCGSYGGAGFRRTSRGLGKDFAHPDTDITVEFRTGPIGIGETVPVVPEGEHVVDGVTFKLFSPTQCVMDRLLNFFYYNDRQCTKPFPLRSLRLRTEISWWLG